MWSRIRHNLPAKIFAILCAILLWFYVHTRENPFLTQVIKEEPIVKDLAPNLVITSSLPSITISIKAPKKKLETLDLNNLKPWISLFGKREGTHVVPVNLPPIPGVSLSYSPKRLRLTLEKILSVEIPVQLVISSPLPSGTSLRDLRLQPSKVTVYAPSSLLNRLGSAQVFFDLSQGGTEAILPVVLLGKDNTPLSGVKIVPPLIRVSALLSGPATILTKTLPVVPKLVGSLPPNLSLQKVEVSPAVVTVTGPSSILMPLDKVETEPIYLNNITSTSSLQVALSPIDKVRLLDVDKVTVSIEVMESKPK